MMSALRFKVWMVALSVCLSAVAVGTQELPKIAVYVTGAKEQGTNKALATQMLSALVNSGKYQTVERSEEFLRQLSAEHVKQRSGAINDDQIKKLGNQFGIDFVCIADVTAALGSYQVSARIVNVETAGIVAIGHANSNLKSLDELDDASNKIVNAMFNNNKPAEQAQSGGGNTGNNIPPIAAANSFPSAQSGDGNTGNNTVSGVFTDTRDGKKYKSVQIDSQTWMAENLNFETEGSKCYGNKPENCAKYGRLYTWNAANRACPAGWRLPSPAEWTRLEDNVGVSAGKKLKSTSGWYNDGNGTDDFGWSALPGGDGYYSRSTHAGKYGRWWSATELNARSARYWGMENRVDRVLSAATVKTGMVSVRCVAGSAQSGGGNTGNNIVSGVLTDTRDGKKYKSVQIDSQTWMAENLNYEAEGSKCYNNIRDNCARYGRFYTWEAANKACPAGWHLPSAEEWTKLEDNVGVSAGTKLKSTSGWYNDGNGTDDFGWSALPGGGDYYGRSAHAGKYGRWWSATELNARSARYWGMENSVDRVHSAATVKTGMVSVRCVQD